MSTAAPATLGFKGWLAIAVLAAAVVALALSGVTHLID